MIQAWIPQYRRGFHVPLRDELARRGIDCVLIQGQPYGDEALKGDAITVPGAHVVEHRVLRVGARDLTWQPCLHLVKDADLVIGDQAAARLINYVLLARQLTGRQRFALWGHGRNFQAGSASPVGEAVKRWMSRRVHWWFAYNEMSAQVVRDLGFSPDRITSVQNAIETGELVAAHDAMSAGDVAALRQEVGLQGDHVAVYVGGMYEQKRLPFLIEACDLIRADLADFEMVFVGGGRQQAMVAEAAAQRSWMHYVGPKFDSEKAAYLRLAKLMLMPGLVGLAILDTFAVGLPLVTVADSEHSPEISYLEDGINGRMLPVGATAADYAAEVIRLMRDEDARRGLSEGGRKSSQIYTIEHMVTNFADGVEHALRI